MWSVPEGGIDGLRRALTWDERLTLACWYLDRCGIREYSEQNIDRAARDKMIVYLFGEKQSKESIAASFGISIGTVTKVLNRLRREHGVAAEIQAVKSRCRNSGCQVAP